MKTKFIGLFLAATMTASLLPTAVAGAEETTVLANTAAVAEEYSEADEHETVESEVLSGELRADEPEIDCGDIGTGIDPAALREELHADEPGVDFEDIDLNTDNAELMDANTVTVSGTVTLPYAASVDGRIGVYLYALEKDGSKVINSSSGSTSYVILNIAQGKKSVNYSLTAPKGNYTVAARYMGGDGRVLGEMNYYRKNGAVYDIAGADTVTPGTAADITLPAAERSISGTVTFTEPIAEDGYVDLSCDCNSSYGYLYQYVPVKKGQTTLDYSIGVRKETYSLQAYVDGCGYRYFAVNGSSEEYEDICYLNVEDKSLSGIDFTYDNSKNTYYSANITVNLGKKAETDKRYTIRVSDGASTVSGSVKVPAGEFSFSRRLTYNFKQKILVSVEDTTEYSSMYSDSAAYYYSKELGVTPNKELATPITAAEADGLIINIPESDTLSGTVGRNGCRQGASLDLFVLAKAGDEAFFTAVTIDAASDSVPFSIDIPKRASSGDIEVYTALRTSNRIINVFGESVSVNGTGNAVTVNAPENAFGQVSGKILFAAPAPADGLVCSFRSHYEYETSTYSFATAEYFVPAGETELSYTIEVLNTEENLSDSGDLQTWVSVGGIDRKFDFHDDITFGPDAKDITVPYKSQTVSGTVKTPQGKTLPSAVSYEIYIQYKLPDGSSGYDNKPGSIFKGETTSKYSLDIPAEAVLTSLRLYMNSVGSSPVYSGDLYYDGKGQTEDWANVSIPMANGLKNADFELIPGKLITGTISVPDDFEGNVYCYIYANGNSTGGKRITAGGEYPYTTTVRYDTDIIDDLCLDFNTDAQSNYYIGSTYYNSNGSTYKYSEAESVELSGDITSDINFNLIKGKKISGTLSFEEGLYIDGVKSSWKYVQTRIYIEGDDFRAERYIENYDTASKDYSIMIPSDFEGEFNIYVDVYCQNDVSTNIARGDYYYTEDGSLSLEKSQAKFFTLDTIGDGVDLVMPAGYCISGRVVVPDNAVGSVESMRVELSPVEGGSSISQTVKVESDGSYKLYAPPQSGIYKIKIDPTLSAVSNIVSGYYYYVTNDNMTTDYSQAADVTVDGDLSDINFALQCGKIVSGKIIIPDDVPVNSEARAYISVYANNANKGVDIKLTGKETDFGIGIPADAEGEALIHYSVGNLNNIYQYFLYAGDNGVISVNEDVKRIAIGESGISGLNLPAVKNLAVINITACRSSYAGKDYPLWPNVNVLLDNGLRFGTGIGIYHGETTGKAKVSIPDIPECSTAKSFKINYDVHSGNNDDRLIYDYLSMYINGDGTLTMDEAAAESFNFNNVPEITFTVLDNSAIVGSAVESGDVTTAVSEAVLDKNDSCVNIKLNTANKTNIAYNASFIVGEYAEDGTFVNAYTYIYSIDYGDSQTDIKIPVEFNAKHKYKLFSWDNLMSLRPLGSSMPITVQ